MYMPLNVIYNIKNNSHSFDVGGWVVPMLSTKAVMAGG